VTGPRDSDGAAPDPAAPLPLPLPPIPSPMVPAPLIPAPVVAGGCSNPIVLVGRTDTIDPATGEVLNSFGSADLAGGRLLVPCGDRRAAVCPACARRYRGDTHALVRLGLAGGRMVPETVVSHPAVFATFTPPGFGPVHTTHADRRRACRPRRTLPRCEHGLPASCGEHHGVDDPLVGQPLCPACYDYPGAVLWQAHAGRLWDRTALATRRALAKLAGLPVRRFAELARLSFVRVAEYQRRGLIHLHAVIRLDGRDGPGDEPPSWATQDALADAVRAAHVAAVVLTPYSEARGQQEIRWGPQLDLQPVRADQGDGDARPAGRGAIASYLAKYASKSTHDAGVPLKRLRRLSEIETVNLTPHARAIITTCWQLGGLPEYRHLRLRAWAHTLGWRGHTSTHSRRYSTTLTALREARLEHLREQARRAAPQEGSRPQGDQTVLDRSWRYVGRGRGPDPGGGRW
jgi:hypothetical protein